ncbi:MAG: GAF domain-containing protein [Bacteroidota bacterium]
MNNQHESSLKRYILYGALIGIGTVLIIWSLDVYFKDLPLSFKSLFKLHSLNPIHYLLDLIPFLATGASYLFWTRENKKEEEFEKKLLDELIKTKSVTNYAQRIMEGDYNVEIEVSDDNEIVQTLNQLKESLKENADQEQKRRWVSEGLATFISVLRSTNDNEQKLFDDIITNLVKYLEANQGGIFILNDDNENDIYLELRSCYAFSRQKFMEKRIEIGQGLVGQAYLEKEMTRLTEIPNDYLHITSGLGDAPPKYIVILPLILNEEVQGVLELASFKKFEEHHIELLEKLGENIASTLSSNKVSYKTKYLLDEAREQQEHMRSQEEELRQNLEELEATQEDMRRKEMDLKTTLIQLEESKVDRYLNESQIQIINAVDTAIIELDFLKKVPPILGVLRSQMNGGTDPQDGSTLESWIDRFLVIISSLLETKKLYDSISFFGMDQSEIAYAERDKNEKVIKAKGREIWCDNEMYAKLASRSKDDTYVEMPRRKDNRINFQLVTPVYYEGMFSGMLILVVNEKPIVKPIMDFEDEGVGFRLENNVEDVLYESSNLDRGKREKNVKVFVGDEGYHLSLTSYY